MSESYAFLSDHYSDKSMARLSHSRMVPEERMICDAISANTQSKFASAVLRPQHLARHTWVSLVLCSSRSNGQVLKGPWRALRQVQKAIQGSENKRCELKSKISSLIRGHLFALMAPHYWVSAHLGGTTSHPWFASNWPPDWFPQRFQLKNDSRSCRKTFESISLLQAKDMRI